MPIKNKTYKVKIDLTDEYRRKFDIPNDYVQYYFINFVTQEGYCYLYDGTMANYYKYNRNTDIANPIEHNRKMQFGILSIAVLSKYEQYFKEGREYAEKYNIPPAKWVQEIQKETEEHIQNAESESQSENDNNDDYIIMPTMSNYVIASYERTACNIAFRTHNRALYKNDVKRAWMQKDEGYTHDNMLTEYKNTWIYYQWTKDDDEMAEDEQNGITDDNDDTPIAVLTAGYMNSEIRLTIRFIMIGGEIGEPSDVSLMLPFDKNYTENDDLSELNSIITPKLTQLLDYIDDTINE